MSAWQDSLYPASWRGLPFFVRQNDAQFGRRTTRHEYPYRDQIWIEDLGRGPRELRVLGYLTGDDVLAQKDEFIAAAEEEGPGELMHPTLGLQLVSLISLGTSERTEEGRVVELAMVFVEPGQATFPAGLFDGLSQVFDTASALDLAAAGDFGTAATTALHQGGEVVRQAVSTVGRWTGQAQRLAGDAAAVVNAVGSLVPGQGRALSRFARGMRSATDPLRTVQSSLARVTQARQAVTNAGRNLENLAGRL